MNLETEDAMAGSEGYNHTPTELCPHPEWWHAWNPYSTEVEVSKLVASFVTALQPEFVLEIGAHIGQTTERIGKALAFNRHGHLVSLEIEPAFVEIAQKRCEGLPVYIAQVNSLEYAPPCPIDLLFVDGHEANRAQDVIQFTPVLSPHAVVICHDMDYYISEMEKILAEWKGEHILLHTPRGLLILTR